MVAAVPIVRDRSTVALGPFAVAGTIIISAVLVLRVLALIFRRDR
jgi:hypothetical protein